jgi:hypothetical protein
MVNFTPFLSNPAEYYGTQQPEPAAEPVEPPVQQDAEPAAEPEEAPKPPSTTARKSRKVAA